VFKVIDDSKGVAGAITGIAVIALAVYLLKRLGKKRRVLLFDNVERSVVRPKRESEPIYGYYNASARRPIAALRGLLQTWFDAYPTSGKKDLLARFRARIDGQHKSAFWELYLHELFTRMKYRLTVHPTVAGSSNHPDFLVSERGKPRFYLEAIVAGLPSTKDAGAEARLSDVIDLVNKMQTPDYLLELQYRGSCDTPPPVRKLRKALTLWLRSIDFTAIDAAYRTGDFDVVPKFEWNHEGLTLFFTPIPKSAKTRGTTNARPIGVIMGEAHVLTTDEDIRQAIEQKAKKYGKLSLPLAIAVNVVSEHCDEIDIHNALFGSEATEFTQRPDGSISDGVDVRQPNGVWFGKKGARNRNVSAVLIGCDLDPYKAGVTTPQLIHNPYAENPLNLSTYPLPQSVPNHDTSTMQKKDGRKASEFLRLLSPWPPDHD
jgi:hypothetical protein